MSPPPRHTRCSFRGGLKHRRVPRGLTLVEMLVAVVLSAAIVLATTAVTQLVVRQHQQISRLDEDAERLHALRQRLQAEARELVRTERLTDTQWLFVSAWRAPAEPLLPRQTLLSCEPQADGNGWYLVLAHLDPLPPGGAADRPAPPPAPRTWGRVGPWSRCGLQAAAVRPSSGGAGPTDATIVWQPPQQLGGATVLRLRVLLADSRGEHLPWVLHVR